MNPSDRPANDASRIGFTLPQRFFTSDAIFRQEQETIFYNSWIAVERCESLHSPADFFLADVAGESIICTMDQDDQLRAFYNTCRHRGTRLITDKCGSFAGGKIQCRYHLWTYACDGELKTAPRMDDDPGFQLKDWPLHSATVQNWQGFVMVHLADNPCPIHEQFRAFQHRLDPWQTAQLKVVHTSVYEEATNWKLILENFNECYHCPSVHPGLANLSAPRSAKNDFADGIFFGGPMQLTKESMTISGLRCCQPFDTLHESDRRRTYYYTLFPNLMLALHPEFVVAWQLDPIAPNKTRIVCRWLFHPDQIEQPDFDPSGAIEFWEKTNRQDWEICAQSYLGIQSKAYRPGPLATNECLLRTIDKHVLNALGQTAE